MRLAPVLCACVLAGCGSAPKVVVQGAPAPQVEVAQPGGARPRLAAAEIPLAFDRGLFHLEGTLSLPERGEGEKLPAVVIVHGSGPMSRDGVMRGQIGLGFGFEMPVYKLLGAALVARGYAVYRYDKRSCGSFNDCTDHGPSIMPYSLVETELSTPEIVGDAEAALDTLAARPEIDGERTFFVGHSEGGELVPLLLSDRPHVRAGVMLAPPFNTIGIVIEHQSERLRWALSAAGEPARAESEGRVLGEAAAELLELEKGMHFGKPILGQPAGIWASWIEMARAAPELARKLDRPLLVLGGSYDYNVAPSEIESWAVWLGSEAHAAHRVRVLGGVTHALNFISRNDPTHITPADIGHDISPELVTEVVSFLDGQSSR